MSLEGQWLKLFVLMLAPLKSIVFVLRSKSLISSILKCRTVQVSAQLFSLWFSSLLNPSFHCLLIWRFWMQTSQIRTSYTSRHFHLAPAHLAAFELFFVLNWFVKQIVLHHSISKIVDRKSKNQPHFRTAMSAEKCFVTFLWLVY